MIHYNGKVIEDKNYKRNYVLFVLDSILFTNAMTFLSVNAVIAYFLNTLGASTLEISLVSVLSSVCIFISQPLFAKMAMERSYKVKTFTKILYTQRFFFLIFILTIPIFAKSSPHFMVILFLICWSIFSIFVGAYSPFFMSLFSKAIPYNKQGGVMGLGGALGNIIALGSSYLVGILLINIKFPYNYTAIFSIGIIFLLIDVFDLQLIKEVPDKVAEKHLSYWKFIRDIPGVLRKNAKVMKIIAGNSMITISNIGLAYYALYAIRSYHARVEQAALFTAIAVVINVVGSTGFGLLADKYGHKLILQTASIFGAAAGIAAFSGNSIFMVYVAFALSTLCASGYNLSAGVIIVHNSPKEQIPIYVSANNMITLIISSFFMITGSLIIDKISFKPLFIIISIAGILGYIIFHLTRLEK